MKGNEYYYTTILKSINNDLIFAWNNEHDMGYVQNISEK